MSSEPPNPASVADARDARRWLIGVSISLVFGLFGAVMALLGYLQHKSSAAPAGISTPAKHAPEPASPQRERKSGDRHK